MKSSNRSQLRLFLLVAAIVLALGFWPRAKANPGPDVEPLHLFEIVGKPAQVTVPGTGEQIELPVGSTFGADEYAYHFDARVTRILVEAEIFSDGFSQ